MAVWSLMAENLGDWIGLRLVRAAT